MKKRGKIIAGAVIIYFIAALGICCGRINPNNSNDIPQRREELVEEALPAAEDYGMPNILTRHSLPGLERMEQEEQEQYVNHLGVIKRIEDLGLDVNDMLCPEIFIAKIEASVGKLDDEYYQGESIIFDGTTSQELQQIIDDYPEVVIDIVSEQIELADTIVLHGNTVINGNGIRIDTQGVEYIFFAEAADNIWINNVIIDGGTMHGIYCIGCDNIKLTENIINGCEQKAICIAGKTDGLIIRKNQISDNQSGALYIEGNVSNGLIEDNMIRSNCGNAGITAGIMTHAVEAECTHSLIVRNNKIEDNDAAGIYFDGAYMCYVLNNTVCGNDKEGIRFSGGTAGCYLSNNILRLNGRRGNSTDDELQSDFVLDAGRMEDGSSKAKLPGILLENAAYNILENNTILGNYGGGIDMPCTAVRNIIMGNVIRNNNAGANDVLSFYGIALGVVDSAADYENIICRNIISGNHYSGIFIDDGCYINDVFDNIIMDARVCGIEAVSLKFNSIINNTTNCGVVNAFQQENW